VKSGGRDDSMQERMNMALMGRRQPRYVLQTRYGDADGSLGDAEWNVTKLLELASSDEERGLLKAAVFFIRAARQGVNDAVKG
jgi:hypothetical protein